MSHIFVEPKDGLISVKVEDDSEANIIKYQVSAQNKPENSRTSNTSNDRVLSELSSLREKYNHVVFELQQSKEIIKSFDTERENFKALIARNEELLLKTDAEKGTLLQKLQLLQKENAANLINVKAGTTAMKKEINELRARIKQIQSSVSHDKSSHQQNSPPDNEKDVFEVQELLRHKETKSGRLFLVRWEGFGPDDDSWVLESNLQCPTLLKTYMKKNRIL